MPTTTGRSRHRQGVHAGAQGAAGEHSSKIMATLSAAIVVIILVLAFTRVGHDIDAATQRFMLYYAGVFALIGLTGSVLLGLVATDRVMMTPGHRVMAQAVHRAFSFGTLAFLIVHIVTEILAQRSHVIDGVIPFLSPFRTFYIGLGTIASDLIVLLVVTSIIRKRFTGQGKAWRWRAIHYASYVAFVFGVLHGLLGGRAAKPYVDWSYGFAIAAAALGLAVRFLANSLRPKEALSAPPGADRPAAARPSPMRAAGLSMAQAQLAGTLQVLPATAGARGAAAGMPGTDSWAALPAGQGWRPATSGPIAALSAPVSTVPGSVSAMSGPMSAATGPFPAVPAPAPTVSGPFPAAAAPAHAAESAGSYRGLGFTPLGAPPYGDDVQSGFRARPYADPASAAPPRAALAASASAGAGRQENGHAARQPRYEPGYDGPPRFEGAPRRDVPQDQGSSYPYGSPGALPGRGDGGQPRRGELPGPGGPVTGPIPRIGTGPMPRAGTGPVPRVDSGPMPRPGTGPMPRPDTGPMPRADTGPVPRIDTGPVPRVGNGQLPPAGTGAAPRAGTGPMPRPGTGPMPRPDTGSMPRAAAGPMPGAETGPVPRAGAGSMPRTAPQSPVGSPQGPRTGRGRRGTGRPARVAGSTDRRRREGPGPTRGDE